MTEHICTKCNKKFTSKQSLVFHQRKKFDCAAGEFQCQSCGQRFRHRQARDYHRKNACKGPQQTIAGLQAQLEQCQTVLAATGTLGERQTDQVGTATPSVTVNQGSGSSIVGNVTNITNNTINLVLPFGREEITHINAMSLEDLRQKIGLQPNDKTMIELFKLIRLNEAYPENHTLLLPDREGKQIHYKDKDGWKSDNFDKRMRMAIHHDHTVLDGKFREDGDRDHDFYYDYLWKSVGSRLSRHDDHGLKAISGPLRKHLHDLTLRLATKYTPEQEQPLNEDSGEQSTDSVQERLLDLRLTEEKTRLTEAEIRKLELQLKIIEAEEAMRVVV